MDKMVASWLLYLSLDQAVHVQDLAVDIVFSDKTRAWHCERWGQ